MKQSYYDELALHFACPACAAPPEAWCRTFRPTRRPAGQRATWLHGARTNPIYLAYGAGYEEGERDGMAVALERPERARAMLAPPKERT